MRVWLIAHCNPDGQTGVAQAQVLARSESDALSLFRLNWPHERVVVAIAPRAG